MPEKITADSVRTKEPKNVSEQRRNVPVQMEDTDIPEAIVSSLENASSLNRSISDWRPILTKECQVYVIGDQYIGKRFDQIYYKYMGAQEAKEVLTDNLYAILLYKYFSRITDEVQERINKIVKALTANLKTFLTKVTFEENDYNGGMKVNRVPNSAVAFSNGIFDFRKNEFICKYERRYIDAINNTIILYSGYIVMWCFDFQFEPLPFSIMELPFSEFVKLMKEFDATDNNYCWELFYNMTHDSNHQPSMPRMYHLAEVLGYTLVPQFLQYFVLLIGSGQNGKNSLFDGCFSSHVHPMPVSNSIEAIESDRFITESLQNACHNIFLETTPKTYSTSNMLKALTGSMYQTIECKGVGKYSGVINCKYIFAGNDQENIRFSDATIGFRRRINLFEIFYSWDPDHHFLKYGDYYPCDFSGDLHEIKSDVSNCVMYIYLGMYGILSATENFTHDFKFTSNEWNYAYTTVDASLRTYFDEGLTIPDFFRYVQASAVCDNEHLKKAFYTEQEERLYMSPEMKVTYKINSWNDLLGFFQSKMTFSYINENGDEEVFESYGMTEYMKYHDLYVSMYYLRNLAQIKGFDYGDKQKEFNDNFKKMYPYAKTKTLSAAQNELYVKCRLINGKIKFVDQ